MMSAPTVEPPLMHDEQYTVGDWLKLPESKQRVELIHGSFVVSPAPATDHQIAAQRFVRILRPGVAGRPAGSPVISVPRSSGGRW